MNEKRKLEGWKSASVWPLIGSLEFSLGSAPWLEPNLAPVAGPRLGPKHEVSSGCKCCARLGSSPFEDDSLLILVTCRVDFSPDCT